MLENCSAIYVRELVNSDYSDGWFQILFEEICEENLISGVEIKQKVNDIEDKVRFVEQII